MPAKRVGGRRVSVPQSSVNDEEALTQYYIRHGYQSKQGNTRLVRASQLKRLLRESDNELCFFVNPTDEPTTAEQAWENLKTSPANPLLSKFRDKVFRSHLPAVPPTRKEGLDTKIEGTDDDHIHRK
ncbi:hypothetical protein PHMEG_00037807 [Phytophthora megakarya]|uniref:Uncharacterized protein n=1 Tax=Phytophthora megakarya TaxID=4795 RepID=A0A225UJ53_9STRA|nr:hypothetical protein PHMEG_00037807 [Phytophthora megakarya]